MPARAVDMDLSEFQQEREEMVATVAGIVLQLADDLGQDELDEQVMRALLKVPRHRFVPDQVVPYAYANSPVPIGYGKTISQPFIVALMTDLLGVGPHNAVLEVGTGLGYQAAILCELASRVYSIEIVEALAKDAAQRLAEAGCTNIQTRVGDGSHGWVEHAPFDRILVTAAPELIPPLLLHQLKPGGRMVLPAGMADSQVLMVVDKGEDGRLKTRDVLPVRFIPLESPAEEGWEEDE